MKKLEKSLGKRFRVKEKVFGREKETAIEKEIEGNELQIA